MLRKSGIRIKQFIEKNGKFFAAMASLLIIISFLPAYGTWLINKLTIRDVDALFVYGQDIEELLNVVQKNWIKKIYDKVSDQETLENFFKQHAKRSNRDLRPVLELAIIKDLFDFYIPSSGDFRYIMNNIFILEIRNNRKDAIRKLSIRVPGVIGVSKIDIIAGDLQPEKIAELEKSWSLNEVSNTLFLGEIEKLPGYSTARIYLQGSFVFVFKEALTVRFEGGEAKVIELKRYDPSIDRILARGYRPLWRSWQFFFITTILVLVLYLVYKTRKSRDR